MYWSGPLYTFGCSYVMLYNIENKWCLFCLFCYYWFEFINYNMQYKMYIYTCATNVLHMNQILRPFLIVGSSVGCPLNCPLFKYLKVVGCPLSCPLYPFVEVVGSLICMAKFPWAAHGQSTPLPTELPTFSYLEVVGCPLRCPMFPYMEVVGSLICMAKFPWAAHSAAHWGANFLIFGSSGLPTELPTELPTVSIYGSSGQPNLHGKIPMGSPLRCPCAAHGQRSGQLPCFFQYWKCQIKQSPGIGFTHDNHFIHSFNKKISFYILFFFCFLFSIYFLSSNVRCIFTQYKMEKQKLIKADHRWILHHMQTCIWSDEKQLYHNECMEPGR